jgi:hypothetical protein
MTPENDRIAAENLAQRIRKTGAVAKDDYADRAPTDKPPAFADALMSEPVGRTGDLSAADWELILAALDHYSECGSPSRGRS